MFNSSVRHFLQELLNINVNPSNAEAFHPKHKDATFFENHLNPVMLVKME